MEDIIDLAETSVATNMAHVIFVGITKKLLVGKTQPKTGEGQLQFPKIEVLKTHGKNW